MAYHPLSKHRIGVTVKSRTRIPRLENESVTLFAGDATKGHHKIAQACQAFNCEPWLAVYVETSHGGDLYLLPLEVYKERYRYLIRKTKGDYWQMKPKYKKLYDQARDVMHIKIKFEPVNWFKKIQNL